MGPFSPNRKFGSTDPQTKPSPRPSSNDSFNEDRFAKAKGAFELPAKTAPHDEHFRSRVQAKAYELYERNGRSHGNDLDDWLKAEKLVQDESFDKNP